MYKQKLTLDILRAQMKNGVNHKRPFRAFLESLCKDYDVTMLKPIIKHVERNYEDYLTLKEIQSERYGNV